MGMVTIWDSWSDGGLHHYDYSFKRSYYEAISSDEDAVDGDKNILEMTAEDLAEMNNCELE